MKLHLNHEEKVSIFPKQSNTCTCMRQKFTSTSSAVFMIAWKYSLHVSFGQEVFRNKKNLEPNQRDRTDCNRLPFQKWNFSLRLKRQSCTVQSCPFHERQQSIGRKRRACLVVGRLLILFLRNDPLWNHLLSLSNVSPLIYCSAVKTHILLAATVHHRQICGTVAFWTERLQD